jgi:hypothetical protein
MPETQTVTVDQLREMGLVTADGRFKGRTIVTGVKRSICSNCGGCYGKSPAPHVKECACPEGWVGTETDLGVLLDSEQRVLFATDKPGLIESLKQRLS